MTSSGAPGTDSAASRPSRLSPPTGRGLTAQERALRSISEAQWSATVQQIAKMYGWRCYVPPIPGRRADGTIRNTAAGWPDLALLRGERLLFCELKREQGKTTTAQDEWLYALSHVPGVTCYLWRPSDVERVKDVLR